MAPINKLIESTPFDIICYSLDWHPQDHISFAENVGMRPLDPSSSVSFHLRMETFDLTSVDICKEVMVTFFTILLIFQKTVASQCTVGDTVVFTGPPKTEQKLWPGHCVQESWGSNFHKDLIVSLISFYCLNFI